MLERKEGFKDCKTDFYQSRISIGLGQDLIKNSNLLLLFFWDK